VTCGRKCWTFIKAAALLADRAKVRKHRSALSCVWPDRHLTANLALAVLANVDHPVRLESQERTATPARTEALEKREALAKMLERKRNCCQFHLSANAWRNQAQLDPADRREPTDHQEKEANQAAMDCQARKARPDHPAHLAPMETLAALVPRETTANCHPARRDPLDPVVLLASKDLLVHQARSANLAKMAAPVPVDPSESLALLAALARLEALALLERAENQVHPAAANTAHQPVSLRVIKRWRIPSPALRSLRRQLARFIVFGSFWCAYLAFNFPAPVIVYIGAK